MSLNDFAIATRSLLDTEWACESSSDWNLLNAVMTARLRGAMLEVRAAVVHSEDVSDMLEWFNVELVGTEHFDSKFGSADANVQHVATSIHAMSVLYTDGRIDPNPWLRAVLELQPDVRWVSMESSTYKKLEADNNLVSDLFPPWDDELSNKYSWWLWSASTRKSLGPTTAIVPRLVSGLWREAYAVRLSGAGSDRVRMKTNIVGLGELLLGRHMELMKVSMTELDLYSAALKESKMLQDNLMQTYLSPSM